MTHDEIDGMLESIRSEYNPQHYPLSYAALTAAIEAMADKRRIESEINQFLGFLCADLSELHNVECPRLLASWQKFKEILKNEQTSDT